MTATYPEAQAVDNALAARDLIIAQQDGEITDLEAEIARLKAQLDPPTLIGTSLGQAVPGHPGPYDVVRVYLSDGDKPLTWDAHAKAKAGFAQVAPGGVLWISWKEAPEGWLAQFLSSASSKAASLGIRICGTQNHEFGNDGPNDSWPSNAQIAEYQRRWAVVLPLAAQFGIETSTCNLGHQTPAQWDPLEVPGATYVGFDRYNPGIGHPDSYHPVSEVFDPIVAYAKSKGKPLAIGETGTGIAGTDQAGRVKWAADARAYLMDPSKGVVFAAWWNQSAVVLDPATATAWFGK